MQTESPVCETNTNNSNITTEAASEISDYLWKKRCDILFQVRLSALYHRKRERFYDLMDKYTKLITILGGSAVFANGAYVAEIGITVAIAGALSLVFDYGMKARNHAELAHDYGLIEADIAKVGERDFTEQDVKVWDAKLASFESKEPPTLTTLVKVCESELHAAAGQQAEHVSWWKQVIVHFG